MVTRGDKKTGTNLSEVQQKTARVTTEPNPYGSPHKLESLDTSHQGTLRSHSRWIYANVGVPLQRQGKTCKAIFSLGNKPSALLGKV